MQATETSALTMHLLPAAPDQDHHEVGLGNLAAFDSRDLFQGRNTVAINHNGAFYRLQATRLGKLILTK